MIADSTELTRLVLAPNAGPMTLQGTNTYLISADWASSVVVDPGPDDPEHVASLVSIAPVALILVTHRHPDHTDAIGRLHQVTGAPVRALDPAFCRGGGAVLLPGSIECAGVSIDVVPTPGHTDDSVSFHLPDDGPGGSMLTGDTILGAGTTVIAHPDGDLEEYFESLNVLESYGPLRVLPGHGPQLPALDEVARRYRAHRLERLEQVVAVRRDLGPGVRGDALVQAIVDRVYSGTPAQVRSAAEKSVAAQCAYLDRQGRT
ncbi:MAG: MBL fold metallo-hydrolase [Nakamurella sp.]